MLEVARAERIYPVFGRADVPKAMNATRDIARVVADTLVAPSADHDTLVDAGIPPLAARSLEGLYDAAARGILVPRGDRTVTVTTPMRAAFGSLLGVTAGR